MIELDDDEFEGHDYCELIDRWDLKFELDCAEGAVTELRGLGVPVADTELDYTIIQRHILDCVTVDDNGREVLPFDILEDMKSFLEAVIADEMTCAADAAVFDVILDLAEDDNHFNFIRWFVHCLPLMWN